MIADGPPIQFEGTWEDILRRGDEFAGRRVRVTVLPQETNASAPSLDQLLAPFIAQAAIILRDPKLVVVGGHSAEFTEGIAEKLRRQGLNV